jgi:hypothetical protein
MLSKKENIAFSQEQSGLGNGEFANCSLGEIISTGKLSGSAIVANENPKKTADGMKEDEQVRDAINERVIQGLAAATPGGNVDLRTGYLNILGL